MTSRIDQQIHILTVLGVFLTTCSTFDPLLIIMGSLKSGRSKRKRNYLIGHFWRIAFVCMWQNLKSTQRTNNQVIWPYTVTYASAIGSSITRLKVGCFMSKLPYLEHRWINNNINHKNLSMYLLFSWYKCKSGTSIPIASPVGNLGSTSSHNWNISNRMNWWTAAYTEKEKKQPHQTQNLTWWQHC